LTGDLTGRRAVVCGSSQGIGRASAEELAARGASVTLLARRREALEEVAASLDAGAGQEHAVAEADFFDAESVAAAISVSLADTGPAEILVNNTGGPSSGPLIDAAPEDFTRALHMHVGAAQRLVQALLSGMKAAGYGRIINIISTSVIAPIPGLGVSNTTRGAMANWARTLAHELGPLGITVNNVLPGYTATDRLSELIAKMSERQGVSPDELTESWQAGIPLRRFADPSEIGAVVGFLASPAAAYVTGVNLAVDGGRTAAQ